MPRWQRRRGVWDAYSDPAEAIVITDSWNHVTDWAHSWKVDFAAQSDPRHSGNCNILWLDGHAEALPLEAFIYNVRLWRR